MWESIRIADVMTYRSDNFTFMDPVSPYNLVSGIIFGTALLIVSFIAKLNNFADWLSMLHI